VSDSSVWVVIPAYNEAKVLGDVLSELREHDPSYNVVVVDDGSSDGTQDAARRAGVHVVVHPVNLGQGAALATGIEYALQKGAVVVVTFDADGQMRAEDIGLLVNQVVDNEIDVALGSRFLTSPPEGMPLTKKIGLRLATVLTRLTTGLNITDTHNGIRAFKAEALRRITITQNRMAHASEILSEISRNKLRYREVPVTIRYTRYSKAKGQSVLNAINILFELFAGGRK
jgi:glycosyltransferase involved in cell wall biosynthesis